MFSYVVYVTWMSENKLEAWAGENEFQSIGGCVMPTAVRLERFKVWMCKRFPTSEDAWDAIAHPGQIQVGC